MWTAMPGKELGRVPLFDPADGRTVVPPLSEGRGWWAGACSVFYDEGSGKFYLYYRLRKPRELGRGVECRIAESTDGVSFREVWRATKEELDTPSMERASIFKCHDGIWRLYISFVDPEDSRWRVDLMEADTPEGFSPAERRKVFTASDIGAEGVKDPWVVRIGGLYYMLLSYAPTPKAASPEERARMHATADVYATGVTKSHSGLAVSTDGVNFRWFGDVLSPSEDGWDAYAARLSCLLWVPPVFVGFYDGSRTVDENYEERTGIATSWDLKSFHRASTDGPVLTSPYASGSLRYMDALAFEDRIYFYYEFARPDGSHELRVSIVRRGG